MSKYIAVKLTEDQAQWLYDQCQLHDELPTSHPKNAFILRIENKLAKAINKAKNK